MRHLLLLTFLTAATCAAAPGTLPRQLHYSFEENRGQFPSDVRYLARGKGYQLFLTPGEAVLSLESRNHPTSVLRMKLAGSTQTSAIQALDPVETRSNYLVGDRSTWRRDIPHWSRVRYTGVYPGVDLVYYGSDGELEYDFLVSSGASPSRIELQLSGAQSIERTPDGALRLRMAAGYLTQKAPVAYQQIAGNRQPVAAAWELRSNGRVGFRLGSYDKSQPLVIDPLLIYSTFIGGDRTDEITSVAVDKDGNTYIAGETTSSDFPSVNPAISKPSASVHGFLTKINPAGDRILYSTYIGGDGNTRANALTVDADGNVFLTGRTGARNFPLVNPVQTKTPSLNIVFVAKLNAQGNKILFSTYLGGERNDEAYGIGLDDAGDIVVAGIGYSSEFPTFNALNPKVLGGGDSFIAKYKAPDYRLAYSTYFGGNGNDEIHGLAVDGAGNAYVTGLTTSNNLSTKDAYQEQFKSQDAFVAKLNADGSRLEFCSYLGGNGYERGRAIKLGPDGSIWVGGYTTAATFPVTSNAFQPKLNGDSDAFLSRLSADGTTLLYSTFLGGSRNAGIGGEEVAAIAIDSDSAVLVSGVTMSPDFPTFRKLQDFGGGKQDGFLVKFSPEGDRVIYSTFLGGSGDEIAQALAVDAGGGVYVGGQTASADYPLKGAIRSTLGGANEGFLTKLCDPFLWSSQLSLTFVHVLGRQKPEAQNFQVLTCAPIPFTAGASDGRFMTFKASDVKTNAQFSVNVDPGSFEVGQYDDVIRIASPDAVNEAITVPVTMIVKLPPPAIAVDENTQLIPGMVVEIRGSDLGPKTPVELTEGADGIELAGTAVSFDEIPAKVIFASDGVVRVVVPDAIVGRTATTLALQYHGQVSNPVKLTVFQPPVE